MISKRITYKTADLAYWRKFNEPTIWYYECEGILATDNDFRNLTEGTKWNQSHKYRAAALQIDLLLWLIKEHSIYVNILPERGRESILIWKIEIYTNLKIYNATYQSFLPKFIKSDFDSYEEAMEIGLQVALNRIEIKKEENEIDFLKNVHYKCREYLDVKDHQGVKEYIQFYLNHDTDINVLHTILVITQSFKENEILKEILIELKNVYENKKQSLKNE